MIEMRLLKRSSKRLERKRNQQMTRIQMKHQKRRVNKMMIRRIKRVVVSLAVVRKRNEKMLYVKCIKPRNSISIK